MNDKFNVLGEPLALCSCTPLTGFYRDGYCRSDQQDLGRHIICAEVTADFLAFTLMQGNDLSTPRPEFGFPGLNPGDRWCLCAERWKEAWQAGCAPMVVLSSCEQSALEVVSLEVLQLYAVGS
ncbi:DUF2237 family protein [Aliagarivorans marinus]|uniref:DUF2237 family protein n=1 Tax=Aliagarivorans marinus TaxID=561965 RepID=UPI000412E930|nr:DUF2237 domain-containing protein [Aliagarivorans marinus]